MRKLTLLTPAVAFIAGFAFSGCGEQTLDVDKAEKVIKQGITEQIGVKVKSLTCPDNVAVKKGAKFKCTVKAADGTTGKVTVIQQDDKGNVSWSLDGS